MNRKIKFRAWDKERKEWLSYFELGKNGAITCYEINETQNLIIQQYTGLLDKNGKEIYEGDICKNGDWEENANAYNYRIEVVEYIDKEACFRGWNFNIDGMTCEVIGNIYENSDLIKAEKN